MSQFSPTEVMEICFPEILLKPLDLILTELQIYVGDDNDC